MTSIGRLLFPTAIGFTVIMAAIIFSIEIPGVLAGLIQLGLACLAGLAVIGVWIWGYKVGRGEGEALAADRHRRQIRRMG